MPRQHIDIAQVEVEVLVRGHHQTVHIGLDLDATIADLRTIIEANLGLSLNTWEGAPYPMDYTESLQMLRANMELAADDGDDLSVIKLQAWNDDRLMGTA